MSNASRIGQAAEDAAERFLKTKALVILDRNFRTAVGEIDIVAQDRDEVVFIEVRARNGVSHGGAAASIDAAKRRKLIKTAALWIKSKSWSGPCRFDIVAVDAAHIEHIVAAFTANDQ